MACTIHLLNTSHNEHFRSSVVNMMKIYLYIFSLAECNIFSRTNSTVFPKMAPHPLGQLVAYCGTGEVAVIAADGDPLYSKSRDMTNAVHVYCALSSNGVYMACLKRGMGVFFLETYQLDTNWLMVNDSLRLHNLVPGFKPSRVRADHVVCKFSLDWKSIAVSGASGYLFLVDRRKMDLNCCICPDLVEDALSSAQAFDFDPFFTNKTVVTLATEGKKIVSLMTASEEILAETETQELVDVIVYSTDGKTLAVGFHNFDIHILERDDLTCVHAIPMSELCQGQTQRVFPYYPAVTSLSLSQNGEHLVSTSCDGRLRLWKIPKLFTLQELCRDCLLSSIPVRKVKKLQLPRKIKKFLLYEH